MKTTLTIALCCLLNTVFAQQSTKSIQVTVSDTIEVLAHHISVLIEFKDTTGGEDYSAERQSDFTGQYAEVTKMLNKYGVPWKTAGESMGGMFGQMMGGKQPLNIIADFTSLEQFDGTLDMLHRIKYVQTAELNNTVDDGKVDKTRLYDKLLKQARKKADMLAKLAGKKTGDIQQIIEPAGTTAAGSSDPAAGLGAFYSQMLGASGMTGQKRPDHKVSVPGSISITYYLVD